MDEKAEIINDLPDPDLKIILLGDSAVGKSKLIERYLMNDYNPRQVPPMQHDCKVVHQYRLSKTFPLHSCPRTL